MVKEGDAGAIGCDKCDGWFHGQCVGITADGPRSWMLLVMWWLLEGNLFKSEAKFELVIKKHEVLFDAMNDIKPYLRPQARLRQTTFQTIIPILFHLITKL